MLRNHKERNISYKFKLYYSTKLEVGTATIDKQTTHTTASQL